MFLDQLKVDTSCIESDGPLENGYIESFNGKLRDELLNGEIRHTVLEAKALVEKWRRPYNRVRPHSSRGYHPTAPEASRLRSLERNRRMDLIQSMGTARPTCAPNGIYWHKIDHVSPRRERTVGSK